jgi:heptaprenyl diphosphate synthase
MMFLISREQELGKPAGGDLLQGNVTLPVLYAMDNVEIRNNIINVHEHSSREEMDEIITMIKQSGAIEKSLDISDRYLAKALEILEELPQNKAKKTLRDIAKFIGKRKY